MLFKKLLLSYIAIILLPLSIVSIFSSYIYARTINEQMYTSAKQTLQQVNRNISNILDNATGTLFYISMNRVLQDNLSRPSSATPFEINREVTAIRDVLLNPGIFNKSYSSIEVYALNKPDYPFTFMQNDVMSYKIAENRPWYSQVLKLNGRLFWHISTDFGVPQISVKHLVVDVKNFKNPIAIISVDINTSILDDVIKNIRFGKTGRVYIIDVNGNTIIPFGLKFPYASMLKYPEGSISINSSKDKNVLFYNTIEETNWKIVGIMSERELTEKAQLTNRIMFTIAIFSIIAAILLSLYLSYTISSPIKKLAKTMDKVKGGDLNVNLTEKPGGEIGTLYESYNSMINRINQLINDVYIANMEKKDAELKALQAQINPHFLYNTLDSMNWLAIKYKAYDISKMITSLATLLRYSINKGQDKIKLKDELKQVKSYVTIQQIRFKDKFDIIYNIDEDILDCTVIKLILQPLVENAITHGIENYPDKGYIEIIGKKDGENIVLEVQNTGNPVDLEKVNRLLTEDIHSEHYGIKNVNDRIKFTFGEAYGLSYNYISGKTIAKLTIPYIKGE
ncbi:two-component system, sensor histidine kinase YesM [Caldanaerobius fijiensis DSM 17918]|uniref:Two-component system, sensor histidine kinase YesM n=1 Tax=Caldanaerobius fijiensis DSM 17918 TaxID=1121256 RepID=A0A1M4X9N3_9THEO|nr:sensor histidine kinase [Caldanaerobius fijiensis]SHE90228.1 two-component system, sensor histidine kinase YesM [Caldanaerobius fijiensis DSM 17918]